MVGLVGVACLGCLVCAVRSVWSVWSVWYVRTLCSVLAVAELGDEWRRTLLRVPLHVREVKTLLSAQREQDGLMTVQMLGGM